MFGLDNLMDMLFDSAIESINRNERVIQLLKRLNLDPDHPPADFEAVYKYALVEYGVGKPRPVVEIFRQKEIQDRFREAFEQRNAAVLINQAETQWAQKQLPANTQTVNIDVRRECLEFSTIFVRVANRTQTPAEVLARHQVASLQQELKIMRERMNRLPTLEGFRTEIARLALPASQPNQLPPSSTHPPPVHLSTPLFALAQQMRGWFETLGFRFESHEVWQEESFEWIINIPVRRGRYDRILVRGIDGEAGLSDVEDLKQSVETHRTDEGWLVTARRISRAARDEVEKDENEGLGCYTLDELLDQDADFSGYLAWLEAEIQKRGIDQKYVPLACLKEEIDPDTQQRIGMSRYDDRDGWIDGYIDIWLDDPAKEHISVLGEFGTGKTWFALHYAWKALQRYREAQRRGLERPRLPLVIPLRDYAKAVSVESLFSEFFFRKHEIPIPGYSAFEQLNRMGKLLLIFDGFDEMAARVDRQEMINNFWELAKVVVPGAKVILTCRTEHFPDAKEGRALLNAELQASTRDLTGETPQFEVLELEKFNDEQIRQVLEHQAPPATVEQIMGNPQLLDLARRPVLTELILEALPDIEAGKPVDMSRVYLYAVRHKMERDIKSERTFTSMADKLYFMCELSWEMLSTDRMSINYREFPDRIRKLFGPAVQEEKDLDHWHYDMMGQTMLIRNAEGDYTPAHRSLLEFFTAYKLAAELGILASDFVELAKDDSRLDPELTLQKYFWSSYFQHARTGTQKSYTADISPLRFYREPIKKLKHTLGSSLLTKAVLDLLVPLITHDKDTIDSLKSTIKESQYKNSKEVGLINSNIVHILLRINPSSLENSDFSNTLFIETDFSAASLRDTDFSHSSFVRCKFSEVFSAAWSSVWCKSEDIRKDSRGELFATGHVDGEIRLWSVQKRRAINILTGHTSGVNSLVFSQCHRLLASASDDRKIRVWDTMSGQCVQTLEGHNGPLRSLTYGSDENEIISASDDQTIKVWNLQSGECLRTIEAHEGSVRAICLSPDKQKIISAGDDASLKVWSISTYQCLNTLKGHTASVRDLVACPDNKTVISGSSDGNICLWDYERTTPIKTLRGHTERIRSISLNSDGTLLASGSFDNTIRIWHIPSGECCGTIVGHSNWIRSVTFMRDLLVSTSDDQTIRVWNPITQEPLRIIQGKASWFFAVSASSDGKHIVSGGDDGVIKIWNLKSGKITKTIKGHANWVEAIAIDPKAKLIASGSEDQKIKIWNLNTYAWIKTLHGHSNLIESLVFTPNGNFLISGSDDQTIKIWEIESGRCVKTLGGQIGRICCVAIDQSGELISSSSSDKKVRIWNFDSGDCLATLSGHSDWVNGIDFHPMNSSIIASCSGDRTVIIWDLKGGKDKSVLKGHKAWIKSVKFSPNGNLIASSSSDRTIRLWEVETCQCVKILTGHEGWINSITFSPDGKFLISASSDESIRMWDVETGENIHILEDKLYQNLNITGAQELSLIQYSNLKSLGALDS